VIPGNDDAIRSITLVTSVIADAIREGQGLAGRDLAERTGIAEPVEPEPPAPLEPEDAVPGEPEIAPESPVGAESPTEQAPVEGKPSEVSG
jgi:hypothetical protein